MRKRVGIARALVLAPELVLYDEPTAGLDPTNARLITELVGSLKAEGATETAMVVTHDLGFARAVSDRIAVLIGGRIAQIGPVETILHSARPEVQAFLGGEAR
jgi:phospholipid/cholesterol/gamma-HCH transport system ATP-binding protein